MIFLEVTLKQGSKRWFVGFNKATILADDALARHTVADSREITEDEARELGLGLINEGMRSYETCHRTFMLRPPPQTAPT